jgi:hypothetical protein
MLSTMARPRAPHPPDKPVSLSVRFPGPVYQALIAVADQERRSVSAQVLYIVERYLAEQRRAGRGPGT